MSKAEEFERLYPEDRGHWCTDNYDLIARALRTQEMVENLPEALAHDVGLVARNMACADNFISGGMLWSEEEIGSGCIAAFREHVE